MVMLAGVVKAALLLGDVTIIVGLLLTVIFIAVDVLMLPLLSVAFALRVLMPSGGLLQR